MGFPPVTAIGTVGAYGPVQPFEWNIPALVQPPPIGLDDDFWNNSTLSAVPIARTLNSLCLWLLDDVNQLPQMVDDDYAQPRIATGIATTYLQLYGFTGTDDGSQGSITPGTTKGRAARLGFTWRHFR